MTDPFADLKRFTAQSIAHEVLPLDPEQSYRRGLANGYRFAFWRFVADRWPLVMAIASTAFLTGTLVGLVAGSGWVARIVN